MKSEYFKFEYNKKYTIEVTDGDVSSITIEKIINTNRYDTSHHILNDDNKINCHLYNIASSSFTKAVINKDDSDFLYELYDMKLDFIAYGNDSSYKMVYYEDFLKSLDKDVRDFFIGFKRYDVGKNGECISGFMDQNGDIVALRNFYYSGFGNLINYVYEKDNKDNKYNEYLVIFISELYLKKHGEFIEFYEKLSKRFKINWFKQDIVPRYIFWEN